MADSFFDDEDSQLDRAPDSLSVSYGAGPSSDAAHASSSAHAAYNTSFRPGQQHTISSRHSHIGAADTSSLAGRGRGRAGSLDGDELDEILAGMEVDHDGVDAGLGGMRLHRERSIVRLQRALSNEQGAPELLEFPRLLVETVVRDLAQRVSRPAPLQLDLPLVVSRRCAG